MPVEVFLVLAEEASLFKVLKVAHGKNLTRLSDLLQLLERAFRDLRLVKLRVLALVLQPSENKHE